MIAMTAYDPSLPYEAAIVGLSVIISALVGHASLQPASGAPPPTTGEKNRYGTNPVRK